ncbi:hypothetical protein PQE73_gp083 [Bacillus phage vB_BanS_MrDarsey]|uniref:Uncharacterized protein n=1 Tax=Bacillus phage vB_BanS_MrDarsey TaxID=2894787 RepID=A0AAE9CC46_9CAUD|nr:hypothetical protein PQE73_gp083 [Bacillus phage vB_BanS_MrDarsey]UGO47915.1 hypothetical protein MRDARSEY_83 [Bacillus phage vB_BanS_MrDarsey]
MIEFITYILSSLFLLTLCFGMLVFIKDISFSLWHLIDRESYEKWENRKMSKLKPR